MIHLYKINTEVNFFISMINNKQQVKFKIWI